MEAAGIKLCLSKSGLLNFIVAQRDLGNVEVKRQTFSGAEQ
jgi:hypothetical protein